MSAVPALRCSGLVHVYRVAGTDVAALRGVDLTVEAGQRIAVLGPSGSGKSTLLQIAAGLMRPSAGRVEVVGVDLATATDRQVGRVRAASLGVMLQGAATNLLLHQDAARNVEFVAADHEEREQGEALLAAAGLLDDRRPAGALSPSEQQAAALAVAMTGSPPLLLADEPTSRLDAGARDRLLDLLVVAAARQGTAVLVVTHDEQVARRMQRMIHLREGRVGEEVTDTGRYAVLGADGSVQLPLELLDGWAPGSLVRVEPDPDGTIRLRPPAPEDDA